jgi:hypothetical protein
MPGTLSARANENDWAIPSGPLPDPPDPGDPVCAYCDGAGCSHCQPDTGNDTTTEPEPDPDPEPAPGTNQTSAQPTTNTTTPSEPGIDVAQFFEQQIFEQEKEDLLKNFRMPTGLLEEDSASVPATVSPVAVNYDIFGHGPAPVGLSESEWQEAADCQQALDVLYAKWPLSGAEIAEVDKLEARRAVLWKKAISIPGLTSEERDRFRLKLHTLKRPNAVVPSVSNDTVDGWMKPPMPASQGQNKPPVPTINPVTSWLVGQFADGQLQNALEFGGELWADRIFDEHSFGDLLGVGKIAVAYKNGGVTSALAESMNFLVGKIPIPQASMAVEGGRQYGNIVFRAQNKFMTDAMKAVGGEFDKDKFWSEFKEDCSVGQRAIMEWIGYGAE